jgi:hypothetical protein
MFIIFTVNNKKLLSYLSSMGQSIGSLNAFVPFLVNWVHLFAEYIAPISGDFLPTAYKFGLISSEVELPSVESCFKFLFVRSKCPLLRSVFQTSSYYTYSVSAEVRGFL